MQDAALPALVSIVILLGLIGAGYYLASQPDMKQVDTDTGIEASVAGQAEGEEQASQDTTTPAAAGITGSSNVEAPREGARMDEYGMGSYHDSEGHEGMGPGGFEDEYRRGRGGMAAAQCGGSPGVYIRELFANHDRFQFNYTMYDDNMTLVWFITAETPELAETLKSHIEQMECILENGGTPRAHDPVFQLEAQMAPYIETEVIVVNETTIKVVKTAENQCAYETIKLHAEVVEGFFTVGMEEAQRIHPVPEDVQQICEPYLSG
ncbi:MAG: hypothetical protein GSR78_03500 [Desulfurococcales archaeon]|nr:hypothetical protein [Desulfurococcales archaeon]